MLIAIVVVLLGLFLRAAQLQWLDHDHWLQQAQKRVETVEFPDTTRGRILDCKGRVLAADAACIDAVVDYRVITSPPDEKWVRDYARARLKTAMGQTYLEAPKAEQTRLVQEQMTQVRNDIDAMWRILGDERLTGYTPERVEDIRQQILLKVQMQQRYIWYANFARAEKQQSQREPAWWEKWLTEESELQVDAFYTQLREEVKSHVILPAINEEVANYLGKNLDKLPGLSLQPGQSRVYPYGATAAHVVGYMSSVSKDEREQDPHKGDPLREYWPDDSGGRGGVEAMCESELRGWRGRWHRSVGKREAEMDIQAQPGRDVELSIDAEVQKAVEAAFRSRAGGGGEADSDPLYGAAVLIDVPTGQVRALVSYPTYDLNTLGRTYAAMSRDEVNKPLLNRATMAQYEPGSTVKPIVGISGVSSGKVGLHEGIECSGYLQLGGRTYKDFGRCWTARMGAPAHHGSAGPSGHHGKYGNPDGFLVMSDALHRSCNVWPETVADRMGTAVLMDWFGKFGLGRPTGIGIPEARGRLLRDNDIALENRRAATWFAAIGQGIGATPIQMANVAATIARDGTWARPTLLAGPAGETTQGSDGRVKLPVSDAAVREAQEGMTEAVNVPGGTGTILRRQDVVVAGKTGTAQAAAFKVVERDENGGVVRGPDGRAISRVLTPSTPGARNPEAPWYRASAKGDLEHAWFIGFAPAEHPQVAFAVMVEYGGGGGGAVAGPIARALLDAAKEQGYLSAGR